MHHAGGSHVLGIVCGRYEESKLECHMREANGLCVMRHRLFGIGIEHPPFSNAQRFSRQPPTATQYGSRVRQRLTANIALLPARVEEKITDLLGDSTNCV